MCAIITLRFTLFGRPIIRMNIFTIHELLDKWSVVPDPKQGLGRAVSGLGIINFLSVLDEILDG